MTSTQNTRLTESISNEYVCRCTRFRFFQLNIHLEIQRCAISLNVRNNQTLRSSKDGQIADKTRQN